MTNSHTPHLPDDDAAGAPAPPPRDELDALLRQWHRTNAEHAAAGRDRLMEALAKDAKLGAGGVSSQNDTGSISFDAERARRGRVTVRSIIFNRYVPLAAAAVVLAVLLPFMLPGKSGVVAPVHAELASNIMMAPEGGRLDALDREGNLMGPCALKHTDVKAEISGRFSRVTVTQQYHNPYSDKIEAVYTFPLSDRGGVDKMTMTIGDRVIVGEVKERESARRVYEQAREVGRTASLLEQERPNIFTQSVANIDPGATINVEISYVEIVAERDGELCFEFPTVVSPRYIPGALLGSKQEARPLPAGAKTRVGVVLAAPAAVASANRHVGSPDPGERSVDALHTMLVKATPIETPTEDPTANAAVWYDLDVAYPDGSKEPAVILTDGRGEIGGRWFYAPPTPPNAHTPPTPGDSFAQPTDKVPDADRITPMPTRPNIRAGHDISISVTLDTGGPGITSLDSPLHKTVRTDLAKNAMEQPRRVSVALASLNEIPNRDFVLKWKQTSDTIANRVFTNTGEHGNFFALQLEPPARVDDDAAVPRELVFVVDTSGSMNGRPMALSRSVMQKAIDAMRPQDTFNIITFAGTTKILWERPRPNTPANRSAAQKFIETWEGSGGTEMMTAIEAALHQTPAGSAKGADGAVTLEQLANVPADGRAVSVIVEDGQVDTNRLDGGGLIHTPTLKVREGLSVKSTSFTLPQRFLKRADQTVTDDSVVLRILVHGVWTTEDGERILKADNAAEFYDETGVRPLRIVMFLTDAEVGNDLAIIDAIIDAIKRNRATTRVFSFGIGNSVNRFLIDQMALAGGGEAEYVYAKRDSEADAAAAIERFNRRTRTPVLTDITLTFFGVQPLEVLPAPENIPDLFDNRPLTFLGRYTTPGVGAVTIKGQTARGRWEKTIPLTFPAHEEQHSSLPTLWARAKIDAVMAQDLPGIQAGQPSPEVRSQIITLGETFSVMSPFTSFVAVDKLRVTINGKPRLVPVPVELPDQTNWAGYFGDALPSVLPGAVESEKERSSRSSTGAGDAGALATGEAAKQAQILTLNDFAIKELVACNTSLSTLDVNRRKLDVKDKAVSESVGLVTGAAVSASPPPAASASPAPAPDPARSTPTPVVVAPPGRPMVPGSPGGGGGRGSLTGRDVPNSTGFAEHGARTEVLNFGAGRAGADDTVKDLNRLGEGSRQKLLPWSRSDNRAADHDGSSARAYAYSPRRGEAASRSKDGLDTGLEDFALQMRAAFNSPVDVNVTNYPDQTPESLVALAAAQLAGAGRYDEAKSLACSNLSDNLSLLLGNRGGGYGVNLKTNVGAATGSGPGNLVQQNVTQPPVSRICGALNSDLPEAEKKAAIEEARAQASAELIENRRVGTLNRKLAPELFARTPSGQSKLNSNDQMGPEAANRLRDSAGNAALADRAGNNKKSEDTADPKVAPAYRSATPEPSAGAPPSQPPTAPPVHPVLVAILVADTSAKTLEALKAVGAQVDTIKPEVNVVLARVMPDRLEVLALLDIVKRVEPIEP